MYRLHFAPDNASLVIRIVLEELGVPYTAVLVDRARREQEGAAFRRLNPSGLIPVCIVDGEPVFETAAIALLLAERHGALAPAVGAPGRATFLKWLFFTANTLHADLRLLFYPQRTGLGDEAARAAFRRSQEARVRRDFAILDAAYAAGEGPWLLGGAPCVVDVYAACCWRWARLYPRTAPLALAAAAVPGLARAAQALEARPATAAACTAEGIPPTLFSAPEPPDGSRGAATS